MDYLEVIQKRERCFKFLPATVEMDKLTTILEAGNLAVSAGNLQNWKFIVSENPEVIKELPKYCPDQNYIGSAPLAIIITMDSEIMNKRFGVRGERLYSIQNAAFAANQMILAALDLGLAYNIVFAFMEERIKEMFDIPETSRPQLILLVGYNNDILRNLDYKDIDEVVYFDKYGSTIKDVHKVFNHYSVEWQLKLKKAKPKVNHHIRKIISKGKKVFWKMKNYYSKKKEKNSSELKSGLKSELKQITKTKTKIKK